VVESQPSKLLVAGSIPVSRSKFGSAGVAPARERAEPAGNLKVSGQECPLHMEELAATS
jgi:hypothetical protein